LVQLSGMFATLYLTRYNYSSKCMHDSCHISCSSHSSSSSSSCGSCSPHCTSRNRSTSEVATT